MLRTWNPKHISVNSVPIDALFKPDCSLFIFNLFIFNPFYVSLGFIILFDKGKLIQPKPKTPLKNV